jgi:hypothetical protein
MTGRKKYIKWWLFTISGIFIAAQFFQPDRDRPVPLSETDLLKIEMGDSLVGIISSGCYDCHSNQTEYPWYAYVVPLAHMINRHVQDGKKALNFSLWEGYSRSQKVAHLSEICEVVAENEMPLRMYRFLHKEARLDDPHKELICTWSERAGLRILSGD